MIRVLIVDDEELARDAVRLLLESEADIEIVGECADGASAVQQILELEPDLVFLDVQMPELSGIEVIEAVGADKMPAVVFATAYDEYAVKAFEASALDYLIKPFSDERFEEAVDRVRRRLDERRRGDIESRFRQLLDGVGRGGAGAGQSRFMARERDSIRFVNAVDIRWVEAAGDYVVLHADDEQLMLRDSMTAMEQKLDPSSFVRIHRSHIVNVNHIREIKPYFSGDYIAYLTDGTELKVSRRYWAQLEEMLSS